VDPDKLPGPAPKTNTVQGVTIRGRLVVNHYGRPPGTAIIAEGPPVTDGWVALNIADPAVEGAVPVEGVDKALLPATTCVWAQACDPEDGTFVITNVSPGNYQLASWDRPLDCIFNSVDLNVPLANDPRVVNGVYDMGDISMVRWFGSMQGSVFYDANGNGFQDPGEESIPKVPVNLRFRDGSMYQQTVTKSDGTYSFTEVFPFFKWLVEEVDNKRWKSSGVTSVVDNGGVIPTPDGWNMHLATSRIRRWPFAIRKQTLPYCQTARQPAHCSTTQTQATRFQELKLQRNQANRFSLRRSKTTMASTTASTGANKTGDRAKTAVFTES